MQQNTNAQTYRPTFLGIAPEIRCLIYQHLFTQHSHQILGLSREPQHDYAHGPPSDWIADSRQQGLVYDSHGPREAPTNSAVLEVSKLINREATPIFYGTNKIVLYAEDNNDIFYWLLDIGERNRRAIRHLEIGWAYGVSIESGRGDIHGILERIQNMKDSQQNEIPKHREQLISVVQMLEKKTVRLIIRTLSFLAATQDLVSLAVFLPGVDAGDIWDLPNPNLYFAEELFSNTTTNIHACIPYALSKMIGLDTLTIGYTKDIALAEKIARSTGAKALEIESCQHGTKLFLSDEEQRHWRDKGWQLDGRTARKTLIKDAMDQESADEQSIHKSKSRSKKRKVQGKLSDEGGGRLMADMQIPGQHDQPMEQDASRD